MGVSMICNAHHIGILATVGPTLETQTHFADAIQAGAVNFRFHLGHIDRNHEKNINDLLIAAKKANRVVSILLDLPSSRSRTGRMDARTLRLGETINLVDSLYESGNDIPLPGLETVVGHIDVGSTISFMDGKISMKVTAVDRTRIKATVTSVHSIEPLLKANVALSLPGKMLKYEMFRKVDIDLLARCVASDQRPDWLALSFVSEPFQIEETRLLINDTFPGWQPRLMAKIETKLGLENVETIAQAADGLMVARGDLLSNIPPEELLAAQEKIVQTAQRQNRVSVIATQLLEHFADSGEYSRAELNDVALAVRQGPTALMLSRETCYSNRPIACIELLDRFISRYEMHPTPNITLMKPKNRTYKVVAVEGPNGVGKSTLNRRLGESLLWPIRLGVADPFMERELKYRMIFEADWRASVYFFIAGAIEIDRELSQLPQGSTILLDRSPWSTVAVQVAEDQTRETWVMQALDAVSDVLPIPDHVLLLEASYTTCLSRIEGKPISESMFDRDDEEHFLREQSYYRRLCSLLPSASIIQTDGLDAEEVYLHAINTIRRMLEQ